MLKITFAHRVLGLSVAVALLASLPAAAQSAGQTSGQTGGSTTGQTVTTPPPATTAPPATSTSGATKPATGTPLSRADSNVVQEMALAHMAEIEAARTAQSKSQNEQVRAYAQQMIDDHTKGLNEVKDVAQAKGVTLPAELDRTRKSRHDKLAALSGDAFDRAYMAQGGVSDHKKVHQQLQRAQAKAKDPEIKALAARTLPIVDQHLNKAQQLQKDTARGSSRTQGTTESSPDKK